LTSAENTFLLLFALPCPVRFYIWRLVDKYSCRTSFVHPLSFPHRKNREMCSKYVTFYANRERVKELRRPERNYGMALADDHAKQAPSPAYSILVHCGNSLPLKKGRRKRKRDEGNFSAPGQHILCSRFTIRIQILRR
jgi:hypothetical protein